MTIALKGNEWIGLATKGRMEFIDLKTQYKRLQPEIGKRILQVLERGDFILGREVAELEGVLAEFAGRKYCITCANGTDALMMALMALDIGPGDAVITTPFTFIATAEVISLVGATPVFVDIDEKTYNIDPACIEKSILALKNGALPNGKKVSLECKAVIPVDLFGLCADYGAINAVAQHHGLAVIEDAAQSFGALYKGKHACSFGSIAATSFFPAKPLGCYGDGGALFTDEQSVAEKMRSIRVHGKGSDKYHNIRIGMNSRLDTLQAAILLAKMTVFKDEISAKQVVAERYDKWLGDIVCTPYVPPDCLSVYAQYSVRSKHRENIMTALKGAGIPSAIYYPVPLHLQPAFENAGYREGMLPVAETVAREIFSLPMHAYLTEDEQKTIASAMEIKF